MVKYFCFYSIPLTLRFLDICYLGQSFTVFNFIKFLFQFFICPSATHENYEVRNIFASRFSKASQNWRIRKLLFRRKTFFECILKLLGVLCFWETSFFLRVALKTFQSYLFVHTICRFFHKVDLFILANITQKLRALVFEKASIYSFYLTGIKIGFYQTLLTKYTHYDLKFIWITLSAS